MSIVGNQATSLSVLGVPFTRFVFGDAPMPPDTLIDTTKIYGTLLDPSGDPREGIVVVFTLLEKLEPDIYIIEKGLTEEGITDSSGYFEVDLAAGKYNLTIDCFEYPDICVHGTDSINLKDLV